MKYQLVTYDLWGNARDGWEINDKYAQEIYEIPDDISDDDLKKLVGFNNPEEIEFDGNSDEYCIYFHSIKTGKPICELQLVGDNL